jgi:hypothetical protein
MSLHSQLQLIEQTWRSGQHALMPSLQDLFVKSHSDAALAWSDLAWLRLRLPAAGGGDQQSLLEASQLLERAHALRQDCWQALDGLCEVHHRLGHEDLARHWGRLALDAKHHMAISAGEPQPSEMARRYANVQSELRVVAFSLFGREPFYSEAAIRNALDVARFYPGWICRFYVGHDVSQAVKSRLNQAGAEVVMPPQAQSSLPGTVWRFMALDDLRVKTVLLRDADSQITEREVLAVQQWLGSGAPAHVMRDHWIHSELMLAGLWGAHTRSLRGVGDALREYFSKPFHNTHADQHFLRDWVWPRIWRDVLQHDSAHAWHAPDMAAALDFPRGPLADEEHVGHAPTQWTQLDWPATTGEPPHVVQLQLKDAQDQLLGDYAVQRHNEAYALRLPPHVIQAIEAGQWRLNAHWPQQVE